ncbi:hypothetical protein HOS75_gp062 [Gordonia phage SteveFrench]|uniref:Uncharacterized protein n=2 Tax=Montyvirus stevefrench TaxID=2734258 RepID=A0A890V3H3_9CAUD|nr:hypothetical protein HOS75_gp062 [Gordonia phage SteveFrench]AUV60668.1 hypothetical protein SEA_STEVEFRENCH_66 [Gordonia phage SteveFrench]QRI45651.1 hypothetical protein SEA_ROYALG_67 [Gordonia phage RoyalG]
MSFEGDYDEYIKRIEKEDRKTQLRAERFHKNKKKRRVKRKRTGR